MRSQVYISCVYLLHEHQIHYNKHLEHTQKYTNLQVLKDYLKLGTSSKQLKTYPRITSTKKAQQGSTRSIDRTYMYDKQEGITISVASLLTSSSRVSHMTQVIPRMLQNLSIVRHYCNTIDKMKYPCEFKQRVIGYLSTQQLKLIQNSRSQQYIKCQL